MADITIGFKGSPDFKSKIDSMVEASGLDKKEWIQKLVSMYELQQLKEQEGLKKYEGDLQSLEEHTTRINEIFTSLMKKMLDDQKQHVSDLDKLKQEKHDNVNKLTLQIIDLEENIKSNNLELKGAVEEVNDFKKQIVQLEELNDSRKTQVTDKDKEINRLEQLMNDSNTNKDLDRIKELEIENKEMKNQLQIVKLEHDAYTYKTLADHQEEISKLQTKQTEEMKSLITQSQPKKRGRPKKIDVDEENQESIEENSKSTEMNQQALSETQT